MSAEVALDVLIAALRTGEVDRVREAWTRIADDFPVLAGCVRSVVRDMTPAALAAA